MKRLVLLMAAAAAFTSACSRPAEKGPKKDNPVIILNNGENNGANNPENNGDPVITECGPGRSLCDGVCIDTQLDGDNCGTCGKVCEAGTVCSDGNCAAVPTDCRTEGECPARYFCDEMTGLCEVGCTSNADCPAAAYCELASHACLCQEAGNVVCGSECVEESPLSCGAACDTCPPVANGDALCAEGACAQQCDDGFLMCDGKCSACPSGEGVVSVSCLGDQCVAGECEAGYEICDGNCAACPATTGDESLGCDGGACIITDCAPGTKLCGGTCAECPENEGDGTLACQGNECVLVCPSGQHSCGSFCAFDDDAYACGANCDFCPTDPNGDAACRAGTCALDCAEGYRSCSGECAQCPDSPGVVSTTCSGTVCVAASCQQGYVACDAGCCTGAPQGTAFTHTSFGSRVSLAVDSRGYPHMAVSFATLQANYYVWWDGTQWLDELASYGRSADVELDVMDRPHMAYWKRNPDQLWYGVRDPANGWSLERADKAFSDVGMTPDLVLVGTTPHIAYYDLQYDNLRYANKAGGMWADQTLPSVGQVGFSPSMAFVGSNPHITSRNETDDRTMHTYFDGTDWSISTVDTTRRSGSYSSLVADGSTLHMVVQTDDTFNNPSQLIYYKRTGSTWSTGEALGLGEKASLLLDPSGSPIVVYWDIEGGNDLAKMAASDGWTPVKLESAGSVGEYHDAEYSPVTGKVHVGYWNSTDKELKHLTFDP